MGPADQVTRQVLFPPVGVWPGWPELKPGKSRLLNSALAYHFSDSYYYQNENKQAFDT